MPRTHGLDLKHRRQHEKPHHGVKRKQHENALSSEFDFDATVTSSLKPTVRFDSNAISPIQPCNNMQQTGSDHRTVKESLPNHGHKGRRRKKKDQQPSSSLNEAELPEYQKPIEFQESDELMLNVPDFLPDSPLDDIPSNSSSATIIMAPPAAPSDDTYATRVIKLPDLPITDDHCFHASVNPVQKNQVTDQIAGENTTLQESLPEIIENLRQELDKKRNELNRIVEQLAALHKNLREKDDLVNEKDIEIEKLKAAIRQLVDHIERTSKTGIVQRTTFLDNNRQQTHIKSLPIGSSDTYKVEENDDSTITMEENDDSTITMDSFSSLSVTF